jgi:Tfp pilus assembly protein PilN
MAVVQEVEAKAASGALKFAAIGLCAVLVAAIGFGAAWRYRQGTIDELNKSNATLAQSLANANGQIAVQNKSIDDLVHAQQAAAEKMKQVVASSQKANAPQLKHASAVLAQKPVAGVDLCKQASQLIDSELTKERAAK